MTAAAGRDARIPVYLLTGFLGSGKTTLLNQALREPALAHTAVVVNELGEIVRLEPLGSSHRLQPVGEFIRRLERVGRRHVGYEPLRVLEVGHRMIGFVATEQLEHVISTHQYATVAAPGIDARESLARLRQRQLEGKFGAGERNRTPDLRITNALLYQLSYSGSA